MAGNRGEHADSPEGVELDKQGSHLPGREQLCARAGVAQALPVLLTQVHLQDAHCVVHLGAACAPQRSRFRA